MLRSYHYRVMLCFALRATILFTVEYLRIIKRGYSYNATGIHNFQTIPRRPQLSLPSMLDEPATASLED
jgi:hypothetical protein